MSKLKILKYTIPVVVLVAVVLSSVRGGCSLSMFGDDIYSGIDHKKNEGYVAFIVNEVEYQAPNSTPQPDPDPEKCACKGTGIITHGDGHTTHCPYHYEEEDEDDSEHNWRCKCDTTSARAIMAGKRRTYCNCEATYGECSCRKK